MKTTTPQTGTDTTTAAPAPQNTSIGAPAPRPEDVALFTSAPDGRRKFRRLI